MELLLELCLFVSLFPSLLTFFFKLPASTPWESFNLRVENLFVSMRVKHERKRKAESGSSQVVIHFSPLMFVLSQFSISSSGRHGGMSWYCAAGLIEGYYRS